MSAALAEKFLLSLKIAESWKPSLTVITVITCQYSVSQGSSNVHARTMPASSHKASLAMCSRLEGFKLCLLIHSNNIPGPDALSDSHRSSSQSQWPLFA